MFAVLMEVIPLSFSEYCVVWDNVDLEMHLTLVAFKSKGNSQVKYTFIDHCQGIILTTLKLLIIRLLFLGYCSCCVSHVCLPLLSLFQTYHVVSDHSACQPLISTGLCCSYITGPLQSLSSHLQPEHQLHIL